MVLVIAETHIKTTADGAIFSSRLDTRDGGNGTTFLNVATPEDARQIDVRSALVNTADFQSADNSDFSAVAPDGTVFRGFVYQGAKQGTLTGGQGVYGPGDVCLFGGFVIG